MNIEVYHTYLSKAANAMDKYVKVISNNMNIANDNVYTLVKNDWLNEDANAFKTQWTKHSSGDSTTEKMKSTLRSQANMLRYAESQYKDAQSKAVGRAFFLW